MSPSYNWGVLQIDSSGVNAVCERDKEGLFHLWSGTKLAACLLAKMNHGIAVPMVYLRRVLSAENN